MYSLKINTFNSPGRSYHYKRNTNNITFGQAANTISKQQIVSLTNKYIRDFSAEAAQYKEEGSGILQPEQVPLQILQSIASDALAKMQNFPKNHKLYIVTGRIGGGKSAFVEQNDFHKMFYAPDADEIKLLLPGYSEYGSSYVHKVSCTINSSNISEALKRGIDTIIQTATTIDNIDDIVEEARDQKYKDIVLIHIDTNEETAIKRALLRGELTGRKIDPNEIIARKYIDMIVPAYKTPLRGLSQIVVYDNNGSAPVKVEDVDLTSPPQELSYVTESDD